MEMLNTLFFCSNQPVNLPFHILVHIHTAYIPKAVAPQKGLFKQSAKHIPNNQLTFTTYR